MLQFELFRKFKKNIHCISADTKSSLVYKLILNLILLASMLCEQFVCLFVFFSAEYQVICSMCVDNESRIVIHSQFLNVYVCGVF